MQGQAGGRGSPEEDVPLYLLLPTFQSESGGAVVDLGPVGKAKLPCPFTG